MKKLGYVMLCVLAMGFVSCSDDDDNGKTSSGGAAEAPKTEDAGISFPVTFISSSQGGSADFTYVDGRMTGGTYDNSSFTISSNPLRIRSEYENESDIIQNIKLNEQGYMTYAELTGKAYNEGKTYTYKMTFSAQYNSEGYLTLLTQHYKEGTDTGDTETRFTWVNGNLMKISSKDVWKDEDGVGTDETVEEYTYENGGYKNANIYFFVDKGRAVYVDNNVFYAGLMGKAPKNIPTYIKGVDNYTVEGQDDEDSWEWDIESVRYNDNGSVSSIVYDMFEGGYEYKEELYYGYANNLITSSAIQQTSVAPRAKKSKFFHSMMNRR